MCSEANVCFAGLEETFVTLLAGPMAKSWDFQHTQHQRCSAYGRLLLKRLGVVAFAQQLLVLCSGLVRVVHRSMRQVVLTQFEQPLPSALLYFYIYILL